MMNAKRFLLVVTGTLSVTMGVVGIVVPVLPTTPFLLLAALCYARSSKRFYDWLVTNRWCGAYIRNYREGRGISRQHKAATIALLWSTIACTAGFAVTLGWVRLLLLCVAAAVTAHILAIKTFRPAAPASARPPPGESPAAAVAAREAAGKGKVPS